MLVLVGAAAGEMAALGPVAQDDAAKERLRGLVSGARERGVLAICAAWNSDAESCKALEDWTRAPDQRGVTNMPAYFTAFESEVLTGMQKILYVSDGGATGAAAARHSDMVSAPRAKLLQLVRGQFVTSLYKSLSGMVENAERGAETDDDEWSVGGPDNLVGVGVGGGSGGGGGGGGMMARDVAGVDASDRNVRMLLTLGNLQALRRDVVPQLITQFETAFAVKLADESKTMRDVLGQIEARLFHSYIRPFVGSLARTIRAGVLSPGWAPPSGGRPSEVRAYVYDVLTQLVLVHAQVVRATGTGAGSSSPTSSSAPASASGSSNSSSGGSGPSSSPSSSSATSALLPQILSYLLEQATREFLDAFRRRARFSLAALMQATLDVEFVAQTLSHYTTDRAAELQAQIYLELGHATEPDAERRLQAELPEMRNVLRSLRDNSRAEFACFRKPRTTAANAATATATTATNNATAAGSSASAPQ
jgi:exocyst complex component 2